MPTYEYICRGCKHEFEEFQSIKADPIAVCPKCRKKKVERKIGMGGAVIFKGGGFYETDYRSESYTKAESAEKSQREAAAKANDGVKDSAGGAPLEPSAKADGRRESRSVTTVDPDGRTKSDPKSGARIDAKTDAKQDSKHDAGRAESAGPSATRDSGGASSDSSGALADNARIADRATHPSRIGRGIGNIVKKPAATRGSTATKPKRTNTAVRKTKRK